MGNVTSVKSKQFVQGTHTSKVSADGTAESLTIDDGGPWVNAQTVTLTSTANNSGRTFVVIGTDVDGAAQTSAATTGPNANTVDVAGTWLSVTSIVASGSITTDISAGVKDGATTGTLFTGRTRVRGMTGNGAAAGHLNFKNTSVLFTGTTLHTQYVRDALIDPYIPDNGILFDDGCYIQATSGAVVGISIFYDG
tara:strand:- start:8 stop:592 length:585 start_codon:yes stop_codon:yes gene_type:complete